MRRQVSFQLVNHLTWVRDFGIIDVNVDKISVLNKHS